MNSYTMTDEDYKLIEKLIEIKNHGFYASGEEVTEVYNRVLNKHVNVTNCGSCLRQRVGELEQALNNFKSKMAQEAVSRASNSVEESEPTAMKEEENNAAVDAGKDVVRERMEKVRAARKNKKKDEA